MNENTALMLPPKAGMPSMDVSDTIERYRMLNSFVSQILRDGTDYGKIPGAGDKATLLKPGAEKLSMFFGYAPTFEHVRTIEDWTGQDHGGEPFFYYLVKCRMLKNGQIMGEGDGSCNSHESKYRYRQGERVCPACGKPTIIKGKEEYGGGWVCFAKKGGCGAKYKDGDKAITEQQTGRVLNPDPADQVNTILKMAEKRALIAATLITVNASDYFTQDIEDLPGYGDVIDAPVRIITSEVTGNGGNGGNSHEEPPSDAEFRKLTSASEERAAEQPHGKPAARAMASLQLGSQIAQWNTWCNGFADIYPYYAQHGKADLVHILRALASEGYATVTPENLHEACRALEARAERKVAGK